MLRKSKVNQTMDLLNIFLNTKPTSNICFLCFKENAETISLFENLELHDDYFELNITLRNIILILLPSCEILLNQACAPCTNLIIQLFTLLQQNYMRKEILNQIIDNIDEEIEKRFFKEKSKDFKIHIDVPTYNSILYNSVKPKVNCNKCKMKFKSVKLLKNHTKIAHKNTNNAIICDICAKIFKKSTALMAHLACHRQKSCPICSKVLKSNSHYNLHLKSHNTVVKRKRKLKLYSCSLCDYKSINKCNLEAHINKHHLNIRPFCCDLCEKGFYKKSNLVEHLEIHKNLKEYTCEICGDVFVCKKTLTEHLKLHNGVKDYECNVCGLKFINSGRRLEHMKRKHMVKSEICVVCSKKFSLRKDLNKHLRKVHGVSDKT